MNCLGCTYPMPGEGPACPECGGRKWLPRSVVSCLRRMVFALSLALVCAFGDAAYAVYRGERSIRANDDLFFPGLVDSTRAQPWQMESIPTARESGAWYEVQRRINRYGEDVVVLLTVVVSLVLAFFVSSRTGRIAVLAYGLLIGTLAKGLFALYVGLHG